MVKILTVYVTFKFLEELTELFVQKKKAYPFKKTKVYIAPGYFVRNTKIL